VFAQFAELWCIDFEFQVDSGERPTPLCLVARELRSGRLVRQWLEADSSQPPYGIGRNSLVVAYYASAEMGCHLALGWEMPACLLDLYAEFRCMTSGLPTVCGNGLLGALAYFGLDGIASSEKSEMRELAMRGGPYTEPEKANLLDYCQTDVDSLARLVEITAPRIDTPRALLRGRYMKAAARMEWNGVPIDTETLQPLRERWESIKAKLIGEVDRGYGVYGQDRGTALSFSSERWLRYLARKNIPWPRLEDGKPALDDDTFKEMARIYPNEIGPIRELRFTLSQLRLQELAVGIDGRNRYLLSAFGAKTGRNQPSNSRSIFGPSTWLRSLIKPGPGKAVAYCDWSQQELAIAASLSGDERMKAAYTSGDFYLTFAKMAGAVPADATKETHGAQREQFKTVALGVLYGLGDEGLARKLNVSLGKGRELMTMHRETFRQFWKWSDLVEMQGMLAGQLRTVFGWQIHAGPEVNARSLRNFPMQGNGAEMMRLATILATERGTKVCAPVHDALLVEADVEQIDDVVSRTQAAMKEASELVLPGFPLRTDAKIIRYPDRYMDPRGERMWRKVSRLLERPLSPMTTPPELPGSSVKPPVLSPVIGGGIHA
jgi:hypothetical protein